MLAYWIILIWVFFTGQYVINNRSLHFLNADGSEDYRTNKWACWLIMLAPLILCFMRSGFVDSWSYVSEFKKMPELSEFIKTYASRDSCQLFYGIESIFKHTFYNGYHGWFAFLAIVQLGCMIKVLSKYSSNISLSFYLFVASGMFFSWMWNGLKQFLAATILFALTDWVLKKEWVKYLLVLLVVMGLGPIYSFFGWGEPPWFLCGIHESALIVFPIVFCANGKRFNKRMWLMLAVLVVILLTGSLDAFLDTTTENTAYHSDLVYLGSESGMGIMRFLVAMVPVAMVIIKNKQIELEGTTPIIDLSINMSVVSAAIYFISTFTSGIFVGRLPIYCELYNLILVPWLIMHPYREEKNWLVPAMIGCYLIYFVYQMYVGFGEAYYSDVLTFL